ncbi:hypothetical protein [Gayadomonas joobiniege]|uniref:hypothetical protein n=1 Tax=Gayadomonas joobiniege TaxID=1234606 RepID=UPI00037741F7|nr:hypothetical protein [Gayadomonas joobiniege]
MLLRKKNNFILFVILLSSLLGCQEQVDNLPPHKVLSEVDRIWAPDFVQGFWRYRGARAGQGAVIVYIQIPEALDMNESQHKTYLVEAVCPDEKMASLWHLIQGYQLYIRTFHYVERTYIEALCINPL